MERQTATVHPSFSRNPTHADNTSTATPTMKRGRDRLVPSSIQHGGEISTADELGDIAENSYSHILVRKKRKIRTFQDMRSLNECERVFINRKRTLMQKARELEQTTGSMVTVTVKSQTGEVYFFANSHAAISALEKSCLLTPNATHEMSSIPVKKPLVSSNIPSRTQSFHAPIQPKTTPNLTTRSNSNSTPTTAGNNKQPSTTTRLKTGPVKNDTSVLGYQNANRSLRPSLKTSATPIKLVFEAKSPTQQKQTFPLPTESSTSEESSSSSDDSESSESEDDDEEVNIVEQNLTVSKNLPTKVDLKPVVVLDEIVKISSEDDIENDELSSCESSESSNKNADSLSVSESSKKKNADSPSVGRSGSSSGVSGEDNKEVSSTDEESSDSEEEEDISDYDGDYHPSSTEDTADTDDKTNSDSTKEYTDPPKPKPQLHGDEEKPEIEKLNAKQSVVSPTPQAVCTPPRYSPFVPPEVAKAKKILRTPFKKNLNNSASLHESPVDFSLHKEHGVSQSLFTSLPTWTLPNFDKNSNVIETFGGEKSFVLTDNQQTESKVNHFIDKTGDNNLLTVDDEQLLKNEPERPTKFEYNFKEGEDLSLHCKNYFEYHFSDEYLRIDESFSNYVLKQEKSNRGCGVRDILHQQANFKILSDDLEKNMPRKLFTHFILLALKNSQYLILKVNYVSRKIPWTQTIEQNTKRPVSESELPDAQKMKISEHSDAKPDRKSMDLFRYSKKYFEYCFMDETLLENRHFSAYVAQQEDTYKSCEIMYIMEKFCCFYELRDELKRNFKADSKLLDFLKNALRHSTSLTFDSETSIKRIYPWNATESWKKCMVDLKNEKPTKEKQLKNSSKKTSPGKTQFKTKNARKNSPTKSSAENKHVVSWTTRNFLDSLKHKFLRGPLKSPDFVTTTKLAKLNKYCQEYFKYCFNSKCLDQEPKFRTELIKMEKKGRRFTLGYLLNKVPLFFDLMNNIKLFPMLNAEFVIEQSLYRVKCLQIRKDTKKNRTYIKRNVKQLLEV